MTRQQFGGGEPHEIGSQQSSIILEGMEPAAKAEIVLNEKETTW